MPIAQEPTEANLAGPVAAKRADANPRLTDLDQPREKKAPRALAPRIAKLPQTIAHLAHSSGVSSPETQRSRRAASGRPAEMCASGRACAGRIIYNVNSPGQQWYGWYDKNLPKTTNPGDIYASYVDPVNGQTSWGTSTSATGSLLCR
jgi:hypothetical protein